MPFNTQEVIEQIKEKLNERANDIGGRPDWTAIIKKVFVQLGHEHGYKVSTSLAPEHRAQLELEDGHMPVWGEWLYDLVWYTSVIDKYANRDIERTTSIPLVMECEWAASLNAIALDFDKLLVANADLRVMVCGGYKNFPAEPVIEQCNRAVQTYEQGHIGDKFLVCIVPEEGVPQCTEIVRR